MMGGADRLCRCRSRGAREMMRGESETKGERRKRKASVARKYFVETFGCQMNFHDSERMAGLLEAGGLRAHGRRRDADVIVINTCSVREKAEEKLYTRLGEIRAWATKRARDRSSRSPGAWRSRKASAPPPPTGRHRRLVGTQSLKMLPGS